jgi:F0F1-type ATP synthase assembly protein I
MAESMSTLGLVRLAALAVGLATLLGAEVAAGAYVGLLLDQKWHTGPWLALSGAFAGLIGGTLMMVAVLKRAERDRLDAGGT